MSAYYQHGGVTLLLADVRDALRSLEPESVQCCVTSPPYWNLRDYNIEPSIWGGDPTCEHAWADESYQRRSNDSKNAACKQVTNAGSNGRDVPVEHALCRHCGAWRGALGLEPTPDLFVAHLVEVFREVRRVLRNDGALWLNLGDSYSTHTGKGPNGGQFGKPIKEGFDSIFTEDRRKNGAIDLPEKNLMGIPWRCAFALQADGWTLRSEITWAKKSCMPESVRDRPTTATEKIFLLTKQADYFYDAVAVAESSESDHPSGNGYKRPSRLSFDGRGNDEQWQVQPTRNLRNFWLLGPEPFPLAHFATFPSEIPRRAILAGTPEAGSCGKCGRPWVRVTKPSERYAKHLGRDWADYEKDADEGRGHAISGQRPIKRGAPSLTAEYTTLGFRPTCQCNAPSRPAIVLDPFSGSGTTPLVAKRLGRAMVGIDIKAEYHDMAIRRLQQDTLPLAVVADPVPAPSQAGMFEGDA